MDQQQVVYYQLYLSLVSPATAGLHPNGTQDWLKFPNGSVSVGTTHLDLLPDHPVPADDAYILVYTESTLAEQTTPVGQALNDSLASVRNVSFTDLDLDQEELGGNVTWEAVPPEEQAELVTLHDVYLAEDEVGAGRSQFASTKGDTVPLEAETPRRSFSHLLVFTRSSLAEQSRAAFLGLSDTTRLVQNLSFVDQDLDAEDLGGNVSWRQPEDSSLVVHYTVYLATSGWGADRSQVAQVEVGSTVAPVQPDTPLNFTQVLVYAQSLLAEQTTPVALNISDTVASVSNVEFVDKDLDTAELGGNVTWTEPLIDYNFVQFYDVYLANSSYGAFRAQLGAPLGAGLAETAVPVDLAQEFHTHIVVYTRSVLVEQSTPVAAQISDTSSDVQNVTFTDEDLDAEDLGGRIYWDSPAEFSQVTGYNIYISQDAFGGGRSLIAEQTLNESRQAVLAADYTLANFRHLVLYSRSSLAEQTTPVAFELSDSESVVVGLNFTDKDLDGSELGGTITWQEAGDSQLVVAYDLYLSESASGEARARLNESLPADVFDLDVPPEFPLGSATHVTIFTRSSLVEQTTPAAINISDAAWNVQEVSFFDMDLDGADLGGRIDWIPPAEELLVTSYVAYLAANASGAASDGRLQIAEVSYTQHFADLAPEQQQDFEGGFLSHVVVFTKSSLVEQTTPTALEVNDTAASVSGIVFVDRDLDEAELGGNITWQAPLDSQLVTLYSVYLSASFDAENRSQIATDVPIGTTLAQLAPETPQRWFTYVNIYTKSPVIEQTTPASLVISDSVAVLADVQLVDEDLDANELGGNISWRVVEELDLITTFAVYFTSNTSWQGLRRRTGEDVVVAEYAQLFIPPETDPPLSSYSWASVFPSSSLAERTTPFSAPVNDTISPVWNISFTDLDLDLQDLGGRITWTEPLEASQVTHYLVYLSANSSGEARSQVANEVPIDQLFIDLVPETPQLDRSFIVVYTRSVLAESTTPSSLAISDSFAVAEVNFTDQDLDATQIGGVISWTAPLPDQHLVDHFVVYLSDSVGNNRSQLSEPFTREVSIPPELYFAPHTHVAVFGASVLAEQTTPSTVEIYDADASVTNIVFQDKDLDELEMGGDILWTAPADSEQVTYYGVFLRGDTTLQIPGPVGGLVPLGTEREFLAADTAIAGFQEVAIFTRSSLVEQSTAVALSIEDEIASVSTVTFQDADQDIDMLGGRIQWQLPNDTSEVDFYVGYFAASPGANDPNDASARRFEFEIVPADFYDLPFQTPQSGFGYFLVYTKSSLAEQTTPTSLEMVDFCQNVPTLENMSLYIEQGTIVLAHYDVPEMVITKLTKVSEDGLSMEFAPLRKGPVTMIITSTTDVVGMTSTHVQNLVNAKGGASCQIDRYLTAACSNVTLQLSGCALPVGGLHNYRLWILQADETTTLPEAAYIDFVIASVLFDQGPLLYFRNQTSVGIQYIPSHQGFEWLYVLPTAGGVADQVFAGEDYLQWNQRVKSAYLGQGCQSMQVPIKGKEVKISFLHDCFFELGQGYRLFILLEDGLNRMDGTLKTMEFVYQGEMTRDSAIPYSHPVPVSTRWRVVPTTSVSSQWKLLRLRMFSDVSCERAVAVFPSPYRDPLLSTLREGAVLPNGAAFSKPGPMPANIFEAEGAWVSGQPCDANGCYIGFSFGVGGEHEAPEVSVACVELLQSEVAGEFAEGLELQYHDGQSYVGYRQASGLKGGLAKLPSFNGTVGIHVDGAKR
ncbi:unnamed protein product [Effrenium voratum]|uniref:Uncharacterized protein n=1 Tax=Effrenium voratum TaxID=2562239 RepID=A0AA36MI30_9DINO|nr:unnamed protein product [Effrenium voratum]